MSHSLGGLLLLALTVLFFAWLTLVGSQSSPLILFFSNVVLFYLFTYTLWSKVIRSPRWGQLLIGALLGFVTATLAAAVSEVWLRGLDHLFARDFTPNLYFYPTASFGWLYGATALPILVALTRSTDGTD